MSKVDFKLRSSASLTSLVILAFNLVSVPLIVISCSFSPKMKCLSLTTCMNIKAAPKSMS